MIFVKRKLSFSSMSADFALALLWCFFERLMISRTHFRDSVLEETIESNSDEESCKEIEESRKII